LVLPGGQVVAFDLPVLEVIEISGSWVVVLPPGTRQGLARNAYGIAADGAVRWQVAPFDFPHGPSPYTGVYTQGEDLLLYNRCGVECRVDPRTGAILATALIK
jgi:hypothetical protein